MLSGWAAENITVLVLGSHRTPQGLRKGTQDCNWPYAELSLRPSSPIDTRKKEAIAPVIRPDTNIEQWGLPVLRSAGEIVVA